MSLRPRSEPFRFTRAYLLRLIPINFGAAIAATVLMVWLREYVQMRDIWNTLLSSCLYSFSIGGPAGLLLPYVAMAVSRSRLALKFVAIGFTILAITFGGCLFAGWVSILLGVQEAGLFWVHYWSTLKLSSLLAVTIGCLVFGYEHLRDVLDETRLQLQRKQLEQERALKLAAEARLSSLESRIHPHFLFNTLNSISSLIPEDPKAAEQTVGRLAALLRFSLDSNRGGTVPLAQELKIVRDYLEIEKTRFGPRLRYSIDAEPEAEQAAVPPLSVQTLVENSVKHAIAPRRAGGEVRVAIVANGPRLEIEVADSGPGFSLSDIRPGHGIENLVSRLNVLFGGAAQFGCSTNGEGGVVRLSLPFERAAEQS